MKRILILISILLSTHLLAQNDWSFLNTSRIGAIQFIKDHPKADGAGTIIFIMDSGMDVGVAGLTHLPNGNPKIIDVQDFSSEGDVYLEPAEMGIENDEHFLATLSGYKLFGYNLLKDQPIDSAYLIGVLDERDFKNSKVNDINANGKTDDRFGIILFQKSEDDWIAYIDLDADGNISDEKPQKDYSENQHILKFRGFDKKYEALPLNMALKIYPYEERVNFHFDGSGHGTHVAGIAAGYKINNMESLNGIAPGAQIISLKIGDTRFSGAGTITGSMREAYDFVSDFAQKYNGLVIVNMSYGIGSVSAGRSDMEEYLDDLLSENRNILICLSAGNNGPGVSSVGLPASAGSAITVGALNTVDNARDVYGGNIDSDKIFIFSARGGEVGKPNVIAPGAASSTIPPFSSRENKWGTSMASPQVAGAAALLLSAAKKENPAKKIDAYFLKKALLNSAIPLKEYLPVEQGNGVVNIPAAYELLKKLGDKKENISGYEISTISPIFQTGNGPAVYWRQGTYLPTKDDKQTIYINPVFNTNLSEEEKNNFYRAFKLSTDANWLNIVQNNVYIKGSSPAKIQIYFDEKKLRKPGIYSAFITGHEKGGLFSSSSAENREFRIMSSVIIPNRIDTNTKTSFYKSKIKLKPGEISRQFILIPAQSSAMALRVKENSQNYAKLRVYAFNQDGHKIGNTLFWDSKKSGGIVHRISTEDLSPGIWEFVFYAPFTNPKESIFDFEIGFSGIDILQKKITRLSIKNGENPSGVFKATNRFSKNLKTKISGRIQGVQQKINLEEEYDSYRHSFNVGDLFKSVEFEIEMPKSTFNKLTDFTINIKNSSGKVLKTSGIKTKKIKITFVPPSSDSYLLELIPGFAFEGQTWDAHIKKSFYYFRQPSVHVQNINFYPYTEKKVYFSLNEQIDVAPNGFYLFGKIWIDSLDKNKMRTTIPIEIESSFY
ncbi:MAG: hypothetical protein D8M58_13545 [Calditrichaeota bacterium]|nr:MAG: hypothetical protein DWQ03_00510 [Calditrichota bacterium]MBL1206423.1 hypothetical protein [Calditrichota bacterium]NOG46249.1 S8 family serine peptidase [Calditrichota bacterium]